jgi:hypothetical protein
MQDYSKEVKEAFAKQYGGRKDLTSGQRLNFQQEVARALLHSEYSSLIPELEQKARCEHDAGMDEWDLVLGDISEAEDISQFVRCQLFPWTLLTNIPTRARDALFDAVYPLLQAIGSYAGCYVTLVAGNSGGDDATEKGFFTA